MPRQKRLVGLSGYKEGRAIIARMDARIKKRNKLARRAYRSAAATLYRQNRIPFPPRKTVVFHQRYQTTLAPGASISGGIYALNNLQDFWRTGTTANSPMYYDQFCAIYGYSLVNKVEITYRFSTMSLTAPAMITIRAQPILKTPASLQDEAERLGAKNFILSNQRDLTYKATYYPHRIFGIKKSEYDAVDYGQPMHATTVSTLPNTCYLYVNTQAPSGSASGYIYLQIEAKFHAALSELLDVASS